MDGKKKKTSLRKKTLDNEYGVLWLLHTRLCTTSHIPDVHLFDMSRYDPLSRAGVHTN